MKAHLDFGPFKKTEADRVETMIGEEQICGRCGATLETYAEKCSIPLETPCPGFLLIEGARLHIRRMADA